MYTIRKKNRIREQLQICYSNGEPALLLEIDLDTYKILAQFNKLKEQLGISLVEAEKHPETEEAKEAVGNAIIAFFTLIFGEGQTNDLLAFYEGSTSEALGDVYAFLCEEIFPQITQAQEALKSEIIEFAKTLKK